MSFISSEFCGRGRTCEAPAPCPPKRIVAHRLRQHLTCCGSRYVVQRRGHILISSSVIATRRDRALVVLSPLALIGVCASSQYIFGTFLGVWAWLPTLLVLFVPLILSRPHVVSVICCCREVDTFIIMTSALRLAMGAGYARGVVDARQFVQATCTARIIHALGFIGRIS